MEEKELKELAELLFPGIDKTPEDYEEIYPERDWFLGWSPIS